MSSPSAREILKSVSGVASGNAASRVIAAVSQLILCVWLSPAEFGYWAAAVSTTALISGLTNWGDVNGYLSGRIRSARSIHRRLFVGNLALGLVGGAIAALYLLFGGGTVGLLILLIAISVPLAGEADFRHAVAIKTRNHRAAIVAPFAAAIVKLSVGVALATISHSAWALAASFCAYHVAMILCLRSVFDADRVPDSSTGGYCAVSLGERAVWAVNAWSVRLPLHSAILVCQFLAGPEMLGILYLSFQATIGISGLIAVPLGRVTLANLATLERQTRDVVTARLGMILTAVVVIVVGVVVYGCRTVVPVLSGEWRSAAAVIAILSASLPARIVTPLVDARQMANGEFRQGTVLNLVDAAGTAIAALTCLSGDPLIVAVALAAWKVVFCSVRLVVVVGLMTLVGIVIPSASIATTTIAGVLLAKHGFVGVDLLAAILCGVVGMVQLYVSHASKLRGGGKQGASQDAARSSCRRTCTSVSSQLGRSLGRDQTQQSAVYPLATELRLKSPPTS